MKKGTCLKLKRVKSLIVIESSTKNFYSLVKIILIIKINFYTAML